MNSTEIGALLWLVKGHWAQFEIFGQDHLPLQVGAWLDVLGDVELADARAVVAALATDEREFPPTAGQIRAEVVRRRDGSCPDADVALAEVLTAVRTRGWTATMRGGVGLVWSHPAIGQAIDALGGWGEVCASDNPEALRAHFTKAYEQAARRAQASATAPPIVGELAAGRDNAPPLPAPDRPKLTAVPSVVAPGHSEPGQGVPSHVADALRVARDAMRTHQPDDNTEDAS